MKDNSSSALGFTIILFVVGLVSLAFVIVNAYIPATWECSQVTYLHQAPSANRVVVMVDASKKELYIYGIDDIWLEPNDTFCIAIRTSSVFRRKELSFVGYGQCGQ